MLVPGARVGPYEVIGAIGAGGMGEVYSARDTNLKRGVAAKVLRGAFASDPHRLARFQREAEALASLNHQNIATVYGLERTGDSTALVMELVEGPTLADRIDDGPIPVDEALRIARQIAAALEAAHGEGVIHRDLKPSNIKVRSDGTVKVLDFGLAKVLRSSAADAINLSGTTDGDLSQAETEVGTPLPTEASAILGTAGHISPAQVSGHPVDTETWTPLLTEAGAILGTAGYVSPEQARGQSADTRADV